MTICIYSKEMKKEEEMGGMKEFLVMGGVLFGSLWGGERRGGKGIE